MIDPPLLGSPIKQQVSDPDEFDSSCQIFNSCNVESIPVDPIKYVDFSFHREVDLVDYKSSSECKGIW